MINLVGEFLLCLPGWVSLVWFLWSYNNIFAVYVNNTKSNFNWQRLHLFELFESKKFNILLLKIFLVFHSSKFCIHKKCHTSFYVLANTCSQ